MAAVWRSQVQGMAPPSSLTMCVTVNCCAEEARRERRRELEVEKQPVRWCSSSKGSLVSRSTGEPSEVEWANLVDKQRATAMRLCLRCSCSCRSRHTRMARPASLTELLQHALRSVDQQDDAELPSCSQLGLALAPSLNTFRCNCSHRLLLQRTSKYQKHYQEPTEAKGERLVAASHDSSSPTRPSPRLAISRRRPRQPAG